MSPKAAFPIMMGSCAFLMPIASLRFMAKKRYSPGPALGLTLGGVPGVLVAAYIVKEAYPPAQARLRRPAIVRPAAWRAQAADADRRDGRYARSHRADHRTRRSQNRSNGPRHLDRCPAQSGGPPCCAPACRPHRRRARCVPRVGRWRGSGGTRPRHSGRGGVQNSAASLPTLVKAPWLTLARRSLTWRGAICRAASSVRSGTIAGHRRCIATG